MIPLYLPVAWYVIWLVDYMFNLFSVSAISTTMHAWIPGRPLGQHLNPSPCTKTWERVSFFNIRYGPSLGMNSCYFGTKEVPFYDLKCHAKLCWLVKITGGNLMHCQLVNALFYMVTVYFLLQVNTIVWYKSCSDATMVIWCYNSTIWRRNSSTMATMKRK